MLLVAAETEISQTSFLSFSYLAYFLQKYTLFFIEELYSPAFPFSGVSKSAFDLLVVTR